MLKKQKSRPLCLNCLTVPSKPNGISKMGYKKYHKYCAPCSKILYSAKYKIIKKKGLQCEVCNFVAKDPCQLEIVHKDLNKKNKKFENLQVYCANCYNLHLKNINVSSKSAMNLTADSDIRIF